MYMRLGFAIASHVEADILLLDEVLAVGDAEFHKKCMAWLQHLCSNGTTVLIVSHALPMLLDMCHRVLWLDQGCVMAEGPPEAVLQKYCPDLVGSGI
jgi:ABC-2 type transport system ATP-binding protein